MKYLPEKFPIRYVITVMDHTEKSKDGDYFNEARSKVLWDQLIDFLQTTPIEPKHLNMRYTSLGYAYKDTILCNIPRLMADKKWAEKGVEMLDEIIDVGKFSNGFGTAFQLGLISYEGLSEIPLFWQLYNGADNIEEVAKSLGFYHWGYFRLDRKQVEKLYNFYRGFKDKNDYWEYEKKYSTNQIKVFNIRVPYSKLWALLEKSKGCIPSTSDFSDIGAVEKMSLKGKPEYIQVTIVKDLSTLLLEEIAALYRKASFCQHCGHILPFESKHQYCPEKENPECFKGRARNRARKRKT